MLLAEHQQGVVPKIVAQFKTGGQALNVQRTIKPPTAAELAQIQACFAKARASGGSRGSGGGSGNGFGGNGLEGGAGGGFGFGGGAFRKCLPARFQHFRATVRTPRQTLRQVLNPPQTNITSEPYTIGGVDTARPAVALVTPAQVTAGCYFARTNGREALLAASYARAHGLKVGSKLDLNGTSFRVVGLVQPPLGGQSADVYLPLGQLQRLAHLPGEANVVLVRATSSSASRTATKAVTLAAPISIWILLVGIGLALLGGLLAGAAGALRAARLRPADALRQFEERRSLRAARRRQVLPAR